MSYLRSLANRTDSGGVNDVPIDPEGKRVVPALFEYLTAIQDPNGEPREGATLLIFSADGTFKACLNDRHTSSHLWTASPTLMGLMDAIEERIIADVPDWRYITAEKRTGRRK